jgi:hypothetical protein
MPFGLGPAPSIEFYILFGPRAFPQLMWILGPKPTCLSDPIRGQPLNILHVSSQTTIT